MLTAFTRNYTDESADAGFQFTFNCDVCNNGFKSTFIESTTFKKGRGLRMLGQGAGIVGGLVGGRLGNLGWAGERAGWTMGERFEGQSPAWRAEHQQAFEHAQNEAKQHFQYCNGCNAWADSTCYNEDAGLCTKCAPRQQVYVAQAHASAMKRNIDEAGQQATVWQGDITSTTTVCGSCGKPAGTGKFCNNCGADMSLAACPNCGAQNSEAVRFCNNCGTNLAEAAAPAPGTCPACGSGNPPGTRFCGNDGTPLA
jgi:hypothetical protein